MELLELLQEIKIGDTFTQEHSDKIMEWVEKFEKEIRKKLREKLLNDLINFLTLVKEEKAYIHSDGTLDIKE
jgi:hypothetical protein